MESDDALIGPASISELRKTVAICTQTYQTDLKIVVNGNYTDGSTIFVSPPPTDVDLIERWILLEGVTIHESWHILFQSDFQLLRELIQKYEEKYKDSIPFIGKIVHDISNIIEDARIEFHGKKRFLGTKNTIVFNNVYWLRRRPSFEGMQDWEIFIEGLLQLSVCDGLKEQISDDKAELLVKVANFYLQWAKTYESSKATFLAADKIMELFLEYFDIKGSYSQQIPSPPYNIKLEPKSNSSNLTSKDLPELPKELQEKLKELQKKSEENKTDSGKCKGKKEVDQDHSEQEAEGSKESGNEGEEGIEKDSNSNEEESGQSQGDMGQDTKDQGQSDTEISSDQSDQANLEEEEEGKEQSGNGMHSSGEDQSNKDKDSSNRIQSGREQNISESSSNLEKNNPREDAYHEKKSSDLLVVNIDDIDPFKLGLIDPVALRIKIDDLVKRNYNLSKDKGLEDQTKYIVKKIEKLNLFKEVFYTKTFDIGVETEIELNRNSQGKFDSIFNSLRSLIQITINQFKNLFKSGSQIIPKLKFGRLDSHKMIQGLINEDPHIFRKNIINEGKNEIAIALLIDQSGSMQGEKILNAQKAAILFGEVLNALNLIFAIYGWTDIPFYDNYLIQNLRRITTNLPSLGNIEYPPELNPEIFTIFCYKDFNEPYEISKQKLGMITALCDNSDHNAIEVMTEKLLQTKKKIKILMVLSDGQPNATSYQFLQYRLQRDQNRRWNLGNIGINTTRQVIETAQNFGIQTLCISIDTSTNYQEQIYGQNNYVVIDPKNIQELPIRVAKILSLILRRSGVKV